jgi:hypothetical protein
MFGAGSVGIYAEKLSSAIALFLVIALLPVLRSGLLHVAHCVCRTDVIKTVHPMGVVQVTEEG